MRSDTSPARLRLADVAQGLSALADGLLVVSALLMRRFLFETLHDAALMIDRERSGREASPTAPLGGVDEPSDG